MPLLSITPLPRWRCVRFATACVFVGLLLFTLQTAISHTKTFPFTEPRRVRDRDRDGRRRSGGRGWNQGDGWIMNRTNSSLARASHRWMNDMSIRGSGGCKYQEQNKWCFEKCGKKDEQVGELESGCHLNKLNIIVWNLLMVDKSYQNLIFII